MKKIKKIKKIKGYTLVELLIATGVISVASVGLYLIYGIASDWQKTNKEVKSLNLLFNEIDSATNTTGKYTGITLDNIPGSSFTSSFNLFSVDSPTETKLNFEYKDVSTRNCTDFISKMLSSSKNISAVINGKQITKNNLQDISLSCDANYGKSDLIIVLNKELPVYTIDTIVASVNPPPTPHDDVLVPTVPTPSPLPTIPSFIPPTGIPVMPNIGGVPPVYPEMGPIGNGGLPVLGVDNGAGSTPPPFIPPTIAPTPPAAGVPPDEIDGEVLPPIKTTETRTVACPSGYTGLITQQRIRTFYQGSGNITYTPWTQTGYACILIPPPPPPPPAPPPPPILSPSTPWASYFYGTFRIYVPNSLDVSIRITPSGAVSGSGLNEWCQNGSTSIAPTSGRCPAGFSYIGAYISLDGSTYYNGVFNTVWRTNAHSDGSTSTNNPLQAIGSSNGQYVSGAFINSYGQRLTYTAYRTSYSY